jgi:uncharacterized protein YndB with AHSA1/START domain
VRKPKFSIPGGDLAGTVEQVGSGVTAFKVGDEVYGFGHGTFAEYIAIRERGLAAKPSNLTFEQAAAVPVDVVWSAWTQAESLREWWVPDKTTVAECEIDLRVGGRLYIVTVAGEAMGKYAGTRWPMEGANTRIDERRGLAYDARSWTDGAETTQTIHHTTELTPADQGDKTSLTLHIDITAIGPGFKAKLAPFGMKWGYKSQTAALQARRPTPARIAARRRDGQPHRPRSGRPPQLVFADRTPATVLHLRLSLPEGALAHLFGCGRPTIHRAIAEIRPLLDANQTTIDPDPTTPLPDLLANINQAS